MHFIDTSEEPIVTIERLFHAAVACSGGNESTLKSVLQSNFGVQEFFLNSSINQPSHDALRFITLNPPTLRILDISNLI